MADITLAPHLERTNAAVAQLLLDDEKSSCNYYLLLRATTTGMQLAELGKEPNFGCTVFTRGPTACSCDQMNVNWLNDAFLHIVTARNCALFQSVVLLCAFCFFSI